MGTELILRALVLYSVLSCHGQKL